MNTGDRVLILATVVHVGGLIGHRPMAGNRFTRGMTCLRLPDDSTVWLHEDHLQEVRAMEQKASEPAQKAEKSLTAPPEKAAITAPPEKASRGKPARKSY